MSQIESQSEPTWSEVVEQERNRLETRDKSDRQLSAWLANAAVEGTIHETYLAAFALEAAERLAQADKLQRLLGLLAPAGTAPRTALEQIYVQSKSDANESPIVLDLRGMLEQHWGEWTPALREARGLPPAPPDDPLTKVE